MQNIASTIAGFLFASALLNVFILLYSFRLNNSYVKTFLLLCLASIFYSIGYAMEICSTNLNQALFWNLVQYIGIPFIPALWIVLALQYNDKEYLLNPAVKFGIFIIPVITLILRYTSNINHLYYSKVQYDTSNLIPVLFIEKGPWYLVFGIYMSICVIFASYLYFHQYIKSIGPIRSQCITMFIASLFPWFSYFPNLLNISPLGLDLGPLTFTFSYILIIVAIFKYQFLNIKPLARDKVFTCTSDGVIVLDANYSIIDFNHSAAVIFPVLKENIVGKNVRIIFGTNNKLIESIFNSKEIQYNSDQEDCSNYYSVKTVKILGPKNWVLGFVVNITDITQFVVSMEKLNYLASRDDLTGIYNRRHFVEISSCELIRAKKYNHAISFILLDLDFFKDINDQFGHLAGDAVLQTVADTCRKSIRSIDILGRFGGEEFVVFLPETRLEDCKIIADRILKNIETAEILYEDNCLKLTASIGITGINTVTNESLDYFIKNADQALYQAKTDGRNCVRSIEL